MPSKANIKMRCLILASVLFAACGTDPTQLGNDGPDAGVPADASPDAGTPAACVPPTGGSAPTYTQLYTTYFAATTTPGHCANEKCHGDPGHNIWLCGTNKDTCFKGMVGVGLINTKTPAKSLIIDPANSPLRWVNSRGGMPADATTANNAGRDAIKAWVAACAQNN